MFNSFKSDKRTFNNSTLNLRVLNQNILYVTRQVDAVLKRVDILIHDLAIQKQANEFYEESKSERFDEDKEPD